MGYFYDTTERILIEEYVREHMGSIGSKIKETAVFEVRIDLLVIDPSPERPFRSLVTCGVGAIPLELPQYLSVLKINRVELVMHMSPEWQQNGRLDWPVKLLHWVGHLPLDEPEVISDLAVFELDDSLKGDNPYQGLMLHYCGECHMLDPFVKLPRKDKVIFLEVIPLLAEELAFIRSNSGEEFIRQFHRYLPLAADKERQALTQLL